MAVYVVDHAEFREREDLVIGVYSGQFGYNMSCFQELLGPCIHHGGSRDIWADAYHALQRYESAELIGGVDADAPLTPSPTPASSKRKRDMHVTCFVERACDRVQDAAGRFTVAVDAKGRISGEAVATNQRTLRVAGVRVDPSQSISEVCLAVLMHLSSIQHHAVVDDLMTRMRRRNTQ
ncbi:hypothetical protein [Caballeronia sp. LZ043]|uniref:hypothetical protein n=1 Tax=Caballeronia sp. LZ043 TaxID=3038569 RepID=UPI00285BACFD|nr:hypothetical protein [Caballeronia sp. LZ043]MDR5819298.1 hypothetical protein [Caballeronia sp. LZ043]